MDKKQKERVVADLAERLRSTDTLIVADYRGLTMPQVDALRTELLTHGARFQVVKNTLTRRAAEEAGRTTCSRFSRARRRSPSSTARAIRLRLRRRCARPLARRR